MTKENMYRNKIDHNFHVSDINYAVITVHRNEGEIRDYSMLGRLTVEYDAMVTRAVHTLYHSPGHSSWQFLAVLPFEAVSTHQLWAFFRFLLLGDDEPVGMLI